MSPYPWRLRSAEGGTGDEVAHWHGRRDRQRAEQDAHEAPGQGSRAHPAIAHSVFPYLTRPCLTRP